MDMSQYRDLFVSEARGHLSAFGELIVRIEEAGEDKVAVDELFRHAHSLKGMAATMGYSTITALAHVMEDQLSRVRSGELPAAPELVDLLLESADALAEMVSQVESGSDSIPEATELAERLARFTPDLQRSAVAVKRDTSEPPQQPATHNFRQSDSFKTVRIKTETLDHLVNITGELITNRYRLVECARRFGAPDFDNSIHQLTSLLRDLRDEVFKARMLPFAFIAERFPRLVRDLARKQGKEIAFHMDGREIELDRGILEELAEPLVHILRNAVDHGMETPDDRVATGKPYNGHIRLTLTRDKDHVDIVIEDDGGGMDPERLKSKAVEKGLISAEQAAEMSLQDAFMLVCAPGFSTAEKVSDISGRGVGMDAVRTTVHSLGGVLIIQSEIGRGSSFILRLPITVSIINALLAKSGTIDIAFPVNAVRRTLELTPYEIEENAGQQTVIVADLPVPVRRLNRILGQPLQADSEIPFIPAMLCETGGGPVLFLADRLYGQQEIFVRPLGLPLSRLRGLNGATITGDGQVVFVADAAALANCTNG
jgi:two-component system chemotaxis sensor kinase CheA